LAVVVQVSATDLLPEYRSRLFERVRLT